MEISKLILIFFAILTSCISCKNENAYKKEETLIHYPKKIIINEGYYPPDNDYFLFSIDSIYEMSPTPTIWGADGGYDFYTNQDTVIFRYYCSERKAKDSTSIEARLEEIHKMKVDQICHIYHVHRTNDKNLIHSYISGIIETLSRKDLTVSFFSGTATDLNNSYCDFIVYSFCKPEYAKTSYRHLTDLVESIKVIPKK